MRFMRYGLSVPNFAEPDRLLEIARAAEGGGWDGWFLWDHILIDREHPVPVSEPWTVLAAAAVTTSRIRLGTMVTPLPRRRPWVLARQVTTVDHLSKGRAILGVGLGVPPEVEYTPFGSPPIRGAMRPCSTKGSPCWTGCGREIPSRTTARRSTSTACSSRRGPCSDRVCRSGRWGLPT